MSRSIVERLQRVKKEGQNGESDLTQQGAKQEGEEQRSCLVKLAEYVNHHSET